MIFFVPFCGISLLERRILMELLLIQLCFRHVSLVIHLVKLCILVKSNLIWRNDVRETSLSYHEMKTAAVSLWGYSTSEEQNEPC